MSWCSHSLSLFTERSLIPSPLRCSSVSRTPIISSIITQTSALWKIVSDLCTSALQNLATHISGMVFRAHFHSFNFSVITTRFKLESKKLWIFHTFWVLRENLTFNNDYLPQKSVKWLVFLIGIGCLLCGRKWTVLHNYVTFSLYSLE